MKKIKVLEYVSESSILPIGGPFGYLYNLTYGIKSNKLEISFLPKLKKRRKKYNDNFIIIILKILNDIYKIIKIYYGIKPKVDLNAYDIIHFHSTIDFFQQENI